MSKNTLYDKVWDSHTVGILPTGQTQLFVGRHPGHEVTSPQAFEMAREKGLRVAHPELSFFVVDHVIPTDNISRPYQDEQAELMTKTLEDNVREFGITLFEQGSGRHGICHVTYPEQGIIWPGQVVACGDSHTCTYGAFGALAFGIGTTQVSHVLATQTLAMDKLKVRRVNFNGPLIGGERRTTAKDLALHMIRKLGVKGGVGYVYEFGGNVIDDLGMNERMTLCNMAVEAGAISGYVNPDNVTFSYLKNKTFAPKKDFVKAVKYWAMMASGPDAEYDNVVNLDTYGLEPMVTWGTNPEQTIGISERLPRLEDFSGKQRQEAEKAFRYMGLTPGEKLEGTPIDVVFIGSCTNGRFNDLYAAATRLRDYKVAVRTLIVPGSEEIKSRAEIAHLDEIFRYAGAEWRTPGCSMCLAMNPDKLIGDERCAATSNRNFEGRQGSPTGRTHLMSPLTAAASAIVGKIADPRKYSS